MCPQDQNKLAKKAVARGISAKGKQEYVRHVLFCVQSNCCSDVDEARATRRVLNRALKQLKDSDAPIYLSEVNCLRFCQGGPLLVVYPKGVWYGQISPKHANILSTNIFYKTGLSASMFSRAIRF